MLNLLLYLIQNETNEHKGSFALGDDDDDKKIGCMVTKGTVSTRDDDKLQCNDVIMNWVLYAFHDDVVMTLLSSSPSANEP